MLHFYYIWETTNMHLLKLYFSWFKTTCNDERYLSIIFSSIAFYFSVSNFLYLSYMSSLVNKKEFSTLI